MALICAGHSGFDEVIVNNDMTGRTLECVSAQGRYSVYPQPATSGQLVVVPQEWANGGGAITHHYELIDNASGALVERADDIVGDDFTADAITILTPFAKRSSETAGAWDRSFLVRSRWNAGELNNHDLFATTNVKTDGISFDVKTFTSEVGTTEVIEHERNGNISGSIEIVANTYALDSFINKLAQGSLIYVGLRGALAENREFTCPTGWATVEDLTFQRAGFFEDHARTAVLDYTTISRPLDHSVSGATTWGAIKSSGGTWHDLELGRITQ